MILEKRIDIAIAAMQGQIANSGGILDKDKREAIVDASFAVADAMIDRASRDASRVPTRMPDLSKKI